MLNQTRSQGWSVANKPAESPRVEAPNLRISGETEHIGKLAHHSDDSESGITLNFPTKNDKAARRFKRVYTPSRLQSASARAGASGGPVGPDGAARASTSGGPADADADADGAGASGGSADGAARAGAPDDPGPADGIDGRGSLGGGSGGKPGGGGRGPMCNTGRPDRYRVYGSA